jgi:hypothetical protein
MSKEYNEGYKAGSLGLTANPYVNCDGNDVEDQQFFDWERGYINGFFDQQRTYGYNFNSGLV